jgi:hypothetical protein
MPHVYFKDNKEYVSLMLAVGVGEYDILSSEMSIAETPVDRYTGDVTCQIFSPNADVSGNDAHRNIYTSAEIDGGGFELTTNPSKFSTGDTLQLYHNYVSTPSTSSPTFNVLLDNTYQAFTDWTVGDTLQFDGVVNSAILFEGHVDIANNVIYGESLNVASQGDKIVLIGAGDEDGEYIVSSITSTQISLNTLAGSPASFTNRENRRIRVMAENHFFGLYEITSVTSDEFKGWTVKKINDPSWTAFPAEYTQWLRTSVEKINGEIDNYELGPYLSSPKNEQTELIALDFQLSGGLGKVENDGTITSRTIDLNIYYRKLNEDWLTQRYSITAATLDGLGETVEIPVPKGTYEVSVERISPISNDVSTRDAITWKRLKSELVAAKSYADTTTICITMSGSNALSNSASKKFNLIATRKLPIYENGSWQPAQATTDIAPFFAYVIKDVGHTDQQIGLSEMATLHNIWKSRGDSFSAVFDSSSTLFSVLKLILAPGMAEPTLDFGQIIPVRDQPRAVFEHMYQPDNMLPPGLERSTKLFDDDEPDGIEVEYFSSETWKPETVMCLLPDELGINPEKMRAFGVTDINKAYQLGMRKRRTRRYRRTEYKFKTEMDALNSRYYSYCALADDTPGYSQTGRLVAASGLTMTVDQPLEWGSGTHFLALRKPDGTLSGPYIATKLNDDYSLKIGSELDFSPNFSGQIELPLFMFGEATRWCYPVVVTNISPEGTDTVSVKAENYDPRIYLDDDSLAPEA